ncbi:MAG: ROK family protein [Fimbriimonadaceae bacterium]|nr:ROK family protein [Fimbriimonadaceae bacterium]
MSRRLVVGVDLGGTNVRAGAFDEAGNAAGKRFENPSRAQDGTEAILDALSSTIQQAIAAAEGDVDAVGIAIPGHIDDVAGTVVWAPNFGGTVNGVFRNWENVPIRAPLSVHIAHPIKLGNDANLAALGEYRYGSGGNSARCMVMLTIGTGIGGGVVMAPSAVQGDARSPLLLLGGNKGGAELGHTIIQHGGLDCNAGTYGAIEAYCQRDSIIQRAVHRLRRGRASLVRDLVEGDYSRVTPRILTEAANQADSMAIEVLAEVGTYLGVGVGNFINVFAPDVVAVGGQIAKAGEWLLGPARDSARNVAIPSLFGFAKIVQAEQIEDAGLLGGAALAAL